MVNSFGSWHDSDDVDSDIEQQAYSLLYYENFNNCNTDVENFEKNVSGTDSDSVLHKDLSHSDSDHSKIQSDNEELSVNLLNSSDSISERKKYSDSDSDVVFVPKVKCSNITGTICVGSSSDDSDFEAMQTTINTTDSAMQMNYVLGKESSLEKKSVSLSSITDEEEMSNVDKLFFTSKHHNDDWKVDFHLRSKFSNRYFESGSKSVCSICTKKGHSDDQCTRIGPVCILCGKEGHMSKRCDSVVCFACFQIGHSTKTCPSAKKFLGLGCRRCGQRGHLEEICPDVWRQYKYTVSPGPPVFKTFSSQNKSTVNCANCAKPGHFTEQCPRNRMNSKFLGPPPIMEIIKYDDFDIYQRSNLRYTKKLEALINDKSSDSTVEFPSFIENMNITTILDDVKMNSDYEDVESSLQESRNSQFGDGFIMLSPIKQRNKSTEITKRKLSETNFSYLNSSTPRQINDSRSVQSNNGLITPRVSTKLPGITTDLLKKLFPEETSNLESLPPYLRKKLRKKLKNFIDNGYLPGDSNMTQDRMEFWLQEISTGRALNYREKKKLLGSVSAALHSISDRVSSTEMMQELKPEPAVPLKMISESAAVSMPEKRKRWNRLNRQEKNIKNSLKISKKEKQQIRKSKELGNSIKTRLRNSSVAAADEGNSKPRKNRKRKRKSAHVSNQVIQ